MSCSTVGYPSDSLASCFTFSPVKYWVDRPRPYVSVRKSIVFSVIRNEKIFPTIHTIYYIILESLPFCYSYTHAGLLPLGLIYRLLFMPNMPDRLSGFRHREG